MHAWNNHKSVLKMYRFQREKKFLLDEDFDAAKNSLMEAIAEEEMLQAKF